MKTPSLEGPDKQAQEKDANNTEKIDVVTVVAKILYTIDDKKKSSKI